MGIQGGFDGRESSCSEGNLGLISGLGRSPGEGNKYPLQYSGLENFMDRGAWQAAVRGGHRRVGYDLATKDQTKEIGLEK